MNHQNDLIERTKQTRRDVDQVVAWIMAALAVIVLIQAFVLYLHF